MTRGQSIAGRCFTRVMELMTIRIAGTVQHESHCTGTADIRDTTYETRKRLNVHVTILTSCIVAYNFYKRFCFIVSLFFLLFVSCVLSVMTVLGVRLRGVLNSAIFE
jgi:hypothetical protein